MSLSFPSSPSSFFFLIIFLTPFFLSHLPSLRPHVLLNIPSFIPNLPQLFRHLAHLPHQLFLSHSDPFPPSPRSKYEFDEAREAVGERACGKGGGIQWAAALAGGDEGELL